MVRIVALDPGGTTGIAAVTVRAGNEYYWETDQLGPEEHHAELWSWLQNDYVTYAGEMEWKLVCESFEFRQNRQRDNINLMSKEYIGVAKLFGLDVDAPVVFQTAGQAKGFVSDDKLKVMDLYKPGQKHAMDAMRHLVTYMIQKRKMIDLTDSWKELT